MKMSAVKKFLKGAKDRLDAHIIGIPGKPPEAVSFAEAFCQADNIREDIRNRACIAVENTRLLSTIEAYLRKEGFHEFMFVGAGDNAVVVRCGDFQAIRLRGPAIDEKPETLVSPQSSHVLSVQKTVDFQGVRLDFVPYVDLTLKKAVQNRMLSPQDAEGVMQYLLWVCFEGQPPVWFWDRRNSFGHKFEQVGFLPNGKPVVIDHGSVIYVSDAPPEALPQLDQDRRLAEQFSEKNPEIVANTAWTPFSYEPKTN